MFAGKDYKKGSIIGQNLFLEIMDNMNNQLNTYTFINHNKPNMTNIILGNISVINHSTNSNTDPYSFDYNTHIVTCTATKDIAKDEEIFINYGSNYKYTWK